MHTLPCTTIAGRFAADRQRADGAALIRQLQDRARDELDRALRFYGLTTRPHFHPALDAERSLWVECRLTCHDADHKLVYAVLDQEGWAPAVDRLSRHGQRYDVLRLRHATTDARLVLIVKVPFGEFPHLEAA